MKTVQAWLKQLDRDRLLDLYASRYPLHAEDTSGNRSYPERATAQREALIRAIDEMISLQPRETGYVFFACEEYGAFSPEVGAAMCKAEDIRGEKCPSGFSWMLTPWEEIAGCPVVETELTLECLYDLFACILFKATMYGYSRDAVLRERRELDAGPMGKEDFLNGQAQSWEGWDDELPTPSPEHDPVRKRLERVVQDAVCRFDRYCLSQAVRDARGLLFPGNNI